MKHLKKFENFKINEFFDFEKEFDIDEDVLSYVFEDLLTKYTYLSVKLVEVNKSNFKVEIYDESPDTKDNLEDEYNFLKKEENMYQIKGHFDVMDFKITDFKYDKTGVYKSDNLVLYDEKHDKKAKYTTEKIKLRIIV